MLDWIPTRAWLLLVIGLIVWPAAVVVRRRFQLSQYDSRFPDERSFSLSLAALCLAVAVSLFIFTPAAGAFGRSGYLLPLIGTVIGLFCVHAAIKGVLTGRVEPMINGLSGTYDRDEQPVRFWLSVTWNSVVGLGMAWALFAANFYIPNE